MARHERRGNGGLMSDVDRRTILAGLRDEPCPEGGNPFLHLHARFRDTQGPRGDAIATVMAEEADALRHVFKPDEEDDYA
jgi:hypothetical protein